MTGVNATKASMPVTPMRSAAELPSPSTKGKGPEKTQSEKSSRQTFNEFFLIRRAKINPTLRKRLMKKGGLLAKKKPVPEPVPKQIEAPSQIDTSSSTATSTISAASSGAVGETAGEKASEVVDGETSEPARQSVETAVKASRVKATKATSETPIKAAEAGETSSRPAGRGQRAQEKVPQAALARIPEPKTEAPKPEAEQGISLKLCECYPSTRYPLSSSLSLNRSLSCPLPFSTLHQSQLPILTPHQ